MTVQLNRHRTHVPTSGKGYAPPAIVRAAPWLAAAAGSVAGAVVVLHLWDASLDVPWTRGGEDIWSVLAYMKTTLSHVWPTHETRLGAPFGQSLQDYPLGDPLQIVLTKLIGIFSGDVAVVTNVFFLLGFPLTASSALWAFRRLGMGTWTAVACALLFALAPYHFFRSEEHLMIASYYAVPLAALLIIWPLAGEVPRLRTTVVLAVIVGLAFTYYAVFTLILLAFAVLVAWARGSRAAALRGLLALAVVALALGLAHVPTWLYDLQHGGNPALATLHTPEQSERFSLKLPRMLFPVEDHRVHPLADLTQHLDERSPTQLEEGPPQALGIAAAVGFLALLWVALSGAMRPARAARPPDPVLRATATAATAAFVLGVTGGFALVIVYTASPLLRSWSRLSIFIMFFALVAVGRGLDWAGVRLVARRLRPAVVGLALFAFVVLAVADQTSRAMVPKYATSAAIWQSDGAFAQRAAAALPRDAFVLQLPYVPFPEALYDEARPFLHTNELRWSFGAMSGRPADWTAALQGLPARSVAVAAAAAGAGGICVDGTAFTDGGAQLDRAFSALLGPPVAVDPARRATLFSLRAFAARVRARLGPRAFARLAYLVLHPVAVLPKSNLSAPQRGVAGGISFHRTAFTPRVQYDLVNPSNQPRAVDLQIKVRSLQASERFTLTLPGGSASFVAAPTATGAGQVSLRPGHTTLTLTDTTKPAPFSQDFFDVDGIAATDAETRQLISRAG